MNVKAAIYLRISLDSSGDGLAIERQREDCLAIAANRGWTVVEVYEDHSISASKRAVKRPAYDRMIDDFEGGRFNAVICYDLDRLTRQPAQLEEWIERSQEKSLVLVTANGDADLSTDNGRMFARIKATVARAEIERKGARQKRALRQRAELGRPPKGTRLTGYEQDGAIVKSEADLVSELFENFAAGETLRGSAKSLDQAGIKSRSGEPWSPSSVRGILTNPRYCGRTVYKGSVIGANATWEPIISEALFDLVQAKLNDPSRKTSRAGTDRKHLGSGLFLCSICGRRVTVNGASYWCKTGGHIHRTMRGIDLLVLDSVSEYLQRPDIAELVSSPNEVEASKSNDRAKDLRQRLGSIEADYDAGLIDGKRFKVASDKVSEELAKLEFDRTRLVAGNAVASLMRNSNPSTSFLDAPLSVQRAVIGALITVRLKPWPRGVKGFDTDSVVITRAVHE